MTRTFFASTALIAAAASAVQADMARYELDPEHTVVYFTVDHIGYAKTLGLFTELSGEFMFDADSQTLGDVSVSINAGSVNTFNDARDGHVRNRDFLHVSEHPQITFVASGGTAACDTSGTVTG